MVSPIVLYEASKDCWKDCSAFTIAFKAAVAVASGALIELDADSLNVSYPFRDGQFLSGISDQLDVAIFVIMNNDFEVSDKLSSFGVGPDRAPPSVPIEG